MTQTSNANHPLANLKVLDFSRVLAGPFAGRMLSDLGADVVKVEPPDGDMTRFWGKVVADLPGYYFHFNAGKRNISMDLRAPGARELVFELVRHADILIENYRPDVMPRLGLGYEDLKAINPRLIMLSISGFGRNGPESRRPAYAPIIHAEGGLLHRDQKRRGQKAHDLPLSLADTNAGLHGLVGILSAVIMRERTGLGQHIDIAMIDATLVTDDQLHYEWDGSETTSPMPNDVWETGAGPILLSSDFRHTWRQLTGVLGVKDPTSSATPLEEKIATRRRMVEDWMAALATFDEVEAAMAKMNIAWGRLRAGAELADQPTLKHRNSIAQVDDRAGGTRPVAQAPYRFSAANSGIRGPAPHRGEHNVTVLAEWLGKTEADVAALMAAGVLSAG